VFTVRSRQHVVITRLNDEEYDIYQRVLRKAVRQSNYPQNNSEAFRIALKIINEELKQEAIERFYMYGLDV